MRLFLMINFLCLVYFHYPRPGSCDQASGESWVTEAVSAGEVCMEVEAVHEVQERWRSFPSPAQTEPQQLASAGNKTLLYDCCWAMLYAEVHNNDKLNICCRFCSHLPPRPQDRQLALLWRLLPQSPAASNRSWTCSPGLRLKYKTCTYKQLPHVLQMYNTEKAFRLLLFFPLPKQLTQINTANLLITNNLVCLSATLMSWVLLESVQQSI